MTVAAEKMTGMLQMTTVARVVAAPVHGSHEGDAGDYHDECIIRQGADGRDSGVGVGETIHDESDVTLWMID